MKKYVVFLVVMFCCISCSDGFSDVAAPADGVTTKSGVSPRNKVEVKEFKYLTDTEKNDLANAVRGEDNLYAKGYAVLADGYAGIVYYKTPSTKVLLESLFTNLSSTRFLRFNDANSEELFLFMGFRYIEKPSVLPDPTEIRKTVSGITFILPVSIAQKVMEDYNCSFAVIQNAMDRMATTMGGNGIRVSVEANRFNYTSELKIQVMGDKRVFTKDTGTQRTFTIIATGLH